MTKEMLRAAVVIGCVLGIGAAMLAAPAFVNWLYPKPITALSGDVKLAAPTDQPPQNCAVVTAISDDQAIEAVVCLPYSVHTWLIQPAPATVATR